MTQKSMIIAILKQCEKLRPKIRTNSRDLENYLDYMQMKIKQGRKSSLICGSALSGDIKTKEEFKTAFKRLSTSQQVQFYHKNCQFIQRCLTEEDDQLTKEVDQPQIQTKHLEIQQGTIFKNWVRYRAEFNRKKKEIRIANLETVFDLHHFIVRKSKADDKQALVLEPIRNTDQLSPARISATKQHYFSSLFQTIQKINDDAILENLKKALRVVIRNPGPEKSLNKKSTLEEQNASPMMLFKALTPKNPNQNGMQELDHIKQEDQSYTDFNGQSSKNLDYLVTGTFIYGLQHFQNYKQVTRGVFYEKNGNKVRKIYNLKTNEITMDKLLSEFTNISSFHRWKPNLKAASQVRALTNSKPSSTKGSYYELHFYPLAKTERGYIYLRQKSRRGDLYYIVDQSIEENLQEAQFVTKGNIKYAIWQLKKKSKDTIEVVVEADIEHNGNKAQNQQLTNQYLGSFQGLVKPLAILSDRISNSDQIHLNHIQTNDFFEELSVISQSNQSCFYSIDGEFAQIAFSNQYPQNIVSHSPSTERSLNVVDRKPVVPLTVLTFRHPIEPQLQKPHKLLMATSKSKHFHWGHDWLIKDDGNLKSINEEMIKIQNGILSSLIKRMGRNLLQGKGIMNTSLPVEVLAKYTFLEGLCKSLAYAPIFLQKAAKTNDLVQRFKAVFCFSVGMTMMNIGMQKPFNPILGETYQTTIDGCPVYGEQISHHPPISNIFMKGRGYTVHGSREADVHIGFTSATGVMHGLITVAFHDDHFNKNHICFSGVTGQLKGLVYGERLIRTVNETIMFDEDNYLYCNLKWNKGCVKGAQKSHYNTFYGELARLNPNSTFDYRDKTKKPKKSDIAQTLGTFHGKWVDKLYFNNQLIFDTINEPPCEIDGYQHILESDAVLRKDRILRIKEDWNHAQDAKEEMELLQRADRKLRKEAEDARKGLF